MRVAYDLRYATDHFTGIGTHAWALLESLLAAPGDERWLVMWDPRLPHRRFDLAAIAAHPRVELSERAIGPLDALGPWRTGAWLRALRPDVYLSPFYLRPEGAGVPALLTAHDVFPYRFGDDMSPAAHALYRFAMWRARDARFIVTSSEFSRGEIERFVRPPAGRVQVVRLGVPPRRTLAPPARPTGLPEGRFALVVGDNRPRKNLAVLAQAWARFEGAPPLALVSAGPALRRYETLPAMAARLGARGVHGLGWVGEGELEWLYAHAEVVLFPSLYEGFGFPLVEAFDRGLVTLASDIPTLREIGEGVATFLPPRDPAAWREAVAALAADPGRRGSLGQAARARAGELSYARTAETTRRLLGKAAGG